MKRLLSVVRRFRQPEKSAPQTNDIHALDEHGLRAPRLTEQRWRRFLMRPKTTGWKLSPFKVHTDERTDLAMAFFWAGDNPLRASWPLPNHILESSRERPVEENRPNFGPN